MILETLAGSAARRAAETLRTALLAGGARAEDVTIDSTADAVTLRGVRSAGAVQEFGSRARPAERRFARALEALRQGDRP